MDANEVGKRGRSSGGLVELLAQFGRESFPKFGMGFDESGDVAEILEALALPAAGIAPSRDLAGQGVFQRGDAHQDAVDVGRDGTAWEIAVEFFGAELDADLGAAGEVDRPFVGFGLETGVGEKGLGPFDIRGGDDQIDVARDHGFLGPMVDGHAADGAPGHFGAFQGFDEAQNVACAAGGLPVVELPSSHGNNIADGRGAVNHFLGAFQGRGGEEVEVRGRRSGGAKTGGQLRNARIARKWGLENGVGRAEKDGQPRMDTNGHGAAEPQPKKQATKNTRSHKKGSLKWKSTNFAI